MSAIGKSVKSTVKSLGKSTAKRVFEESLELLQEGKKQVLNEENETSPQRTSESVVDKSMRNGLPEGYEKKVKVQEKQKLENLDRRIQEIRKQKLVEDLQKRISDGEDVSLISYPELDWEQRQVLQAQMQAVKERKLWVMQKGGDDLFEPGTKRRKGFFRSRGMKGRVEKLKRKSEIRMPPSG